MKLHVLTMCSLLSSFFNNDLEQTQSKTSISHAIVACPTIGDSHCHWVNPHDLDCQDIRDSIFEHATRPLSQESRQQLTHSLYAFHAENCDQNPTLPQIDKGLIQRFNDNFPN